MPNTKFLIEVRVTNMRLNSINDIQETIRSLSNFKNIKPMNNTETQEDRNRRIATTQSDTNSRTAVNNN